MAHVARNDVEREDDRAVISGILLKGGAELTTIDVWRALNHHRQTIARETALQTGKTPEDADAVAREAQVSIRTVRSDIRVLENRVQNASLAGTAALLDNQVREIQEEIETTLEMDEEILSDLEASRRAGAADQALYGRFQANALLRIKLRAEKRVVCMGRMSIPIDVAAVNQTMAQAISGLDDPEAANEACLRLIRRELVELTAAVGAPLAGDMIHMEKTRIATMEARLRSLSRIREYVKSENGDGTPRSIEVVFERVQRRQLQQPPPEANAAEEIP